MEDIPLGERFYNAHDNKLFGFFDWQKDAVYMNLRSEERIWVTGVETDYVRVVRGVGGTVTQLILLTDKFIKV